ncbi:N-acetylmuramoyl-L-alanine amidase [Myxococcota bacterium]|nr:N-acetylmuramoyl-L-alanine amidase [Myxococcota bacterium]
MSALLSFALWSNVAAAGSLNPVFERAAAEYDVPAPLLMALAYEASRIEPTATSAWGGYGLFDLREDDESDGPGIEQVSMLLGVSPDVVRADVDAQVRGAAALLAWHAKNLSDDGSLPPVEALEDWAPALRGFSGRQEPELQAMYVEYLYEVVSSGFAVKDAYNLPREVNFDAVTLGVAPPAPGGDYAGVDSFVNASSSNYSNYSRDASDINYVIIHTVQGSYSGCISWFQNSSASVSAHYVVRSSDGAITQMVWEEDVAWHAGNWTYNEQSVGIEHEGYVDDPGKWYTTAMYTESAKLTADIAARNGIPLDRSHIIGHVEVPSATHTDPGTGWDWDYYMGLLDGSGGVVDTAELLGKVADSDIYSGAPLTGVTVTLDQTGETTTTDASGLYRFDSLGSGTWSVTVRADGYDDGSCTKDITSGSGQWWCSVALFPATTGGDDGGGDSGGGDSGEPTDDTAEPTDDTDDPGRPSPGGEDEAATPGERVAMSSLGCAAAPGPVSLGGLLVGALFVLRRRRA